VLKKQSNNNQERVVDPRKETAFVSEASSEQSRIEHSPHPIEESSKRKGLCKKIRFKWVC